jgi:hypothetical protein
MEHRTIVLLFPTGQWMWSEDFHFGNHKDLGKFVEVFFTKGFSDREVDEVIRDYYTANVEHLFD